MFFLWTNKPRKNPRKPPDQIFRVHSYMTFHREPSAREFDIFSMFIKEFAKYRRTSEGFIFTFFGAIPHVVSQLFSPWDLSTNTYILKRFPERVHTLADSVFPVPSFPLSHVPRRFILAELSVCSDSDGDSPAFSFSTAHLPLKTPSLARRVRKFDSSANSMRPALP